MQVKRIHRPHYHFSYATSFAKHYTTIVGVLVFITLLLLILFPLFVHPRPEQFNTISLYGLLSLSIATLVRLLIAYIFSLIVAVPLALTINIPGLEKILLPFFDVIESIPVLAFFPFVVLVFIKFHMTEGAAIFILFMAMVWNIVFSAIGGLKSIPKEINEAAFVFKAKGWRKLFLVTLPAIFPYLLTGSMLAWAQGWNIIIVAEVLHTYIPGGTPQQDLRGLGSLLVNATYHANNALFISGLVIMILLIATINFFVWQRLLRYAERFRFE